MSRRAVLLALCCCLAPLRAAADLPLSSGRSSQPSRHFVIGAPGRFDDAADRRQPRRYQRADSTVGAYVDVEAVRDATWLRHEIEGYAREVSDCAALGASWCRREVLVVGGKPVLYVAAGVRAEALWLADGNRAVRLGWRRVVETVTGTLTLDEPPADFAAAVLAELPSQLAEVRLDPDRDEVWIAEEVERLLYYIDRMLTALPSTPTAEERGRAERFVAANLERIARLRHLDLGPVDGGGQPAPERAAGVLSARLAEQLGAVRAWREETKHESTDAAMLPWCAPPPLSLPQQTSAAAIALPQSGD